MKAFHLRGSVLLALSICIFSLQSGTLEAFEGHNNIGVGYGIPSGGGAGISFEREVDVNILFSAGPAVALGHTLNGEVGWEAGFQTHFRSQYSFIRPGLSVWYGRNSDNEEGFSYGGSARMQLGRMIQVSTSTNNYLDLYILYNDTSSSIKLATAYILKF